jgi:hypothetical protein
LANKQTNEPTKVNTNLDENEISRGESVWNDFFQMTRFCFLIFGQNLTDGDQK